jgi:hypothetical protein
MFNKLYIHMARKRTGYMTGGALSRPTEIKVPQINKTFQKTYFLHCPKVFS